MPGNILGAIAKDVWLTPGEGVCGIWTLNCYLSVILLFYMDAGGRGSRNPGFSRTSFKNGPLHTINHCVILVLCIICFQHSQTFQSAAQNQCQKLYRNRYCRKHTAVEYRKSVKRIARVIS